MPKKVGPPQKNSLHPLLVECFRFESEHAKEKRVNLASPCVSSLVLGRSIDTGPYPFGLDIFTRSFLSVDDE